MAYQEVTKTSYGSRLGNSLKGILTGLVLFVAATVLLWVNEGNAKKKADVIKEFDKRCVIVEDVSSVDPELDGKPIHATAIAKTDEILTDPDFGVSANAIRIVREVEYYQWVETSSSESTDKIGGSQETVTNYDYHLAWVNDPVDSGSFKDPDYQNSNFVRKTIPDNTVTAQKVDFGAYILPAGLVNVIPDNVALEVPQPETSGEDMVINGNVVYYGDPSKPQVGDVRVTFTKAVGGKASILAKVKGNTFEEYKSKAKNNSKSFWMLEMGDCSEEEMIESAKSANKMWLWVIRILGILLVIAALRMMFSILVTILKVLPFLANVAALGVNLVTGVVGFIWALIVIMIAWVAYRPLLAVALAVVIAALIYFLISKSKKAPAAEPAAAPES